MKRSEHFCKRDLILVPSSFSNHGAKCLYPRPQAHTWASLIPLKEPYSISTRTLSQASRRITVNTHVSLILKVSLQYVDNQAGLGGAIYCYNCFSLKFFNAPMFHYNFAYQGGFMFLDYSSPNQCNNYT